MLGEVRVAIPPEHYRPHSQQRRFHRSGKRFVAAIAGTRGGKTNAGGAEFAVRVLRDVQAGKGRRPAGRGRNRRSRLHYWVISPVAWLLKEPMRYLQEMIPPALLENPANPINDENQMWLKGDILIEFKSAERPERLVSVGLNGVWIDEAARLKDGAWSGNVRGRLTDQSGWALFTSTPLGRNWLYREVAVKGLPGPDADPDFETIQWTTSQNDYIPREDIESARRTLPWRYFKREYEASFDAFSGTVYDEFDDKIHVFDAPPDPAIFRRIVFAQDFGWSSPGSLLVIGDLGGRFMVLDEVYESNLTVHDARAEQLGQRTWVSEAKRLAVKWCKHQRGVQVFADPSRADAIHDQIRSGVNTVGADNDVVYGIRCVSTALHPVDGKPALTIWRGCTNLLREMRDYVYALDKQGNPTEYPADGQRDHALDALRYGIVPLMVHSDLTTPGQKTAAQLWTERRTPRVIG